MAATAETWERLAQRLERMAAVPSVPQDAVDVLALQQGALLLRTRAGEARRAEDDTQRLGPR